MISIIIVNFNLSSDIIRCLSSVETYPPEQGYEVIVVDNCSSDESLPALFEYLRKRPGCRYLQLTSNTGFGSACNAGARLARGQDLCFLNPDTIVHDDALSRLVVIRDKTGCALIGPGYGPPRHLEFSAGLFPGVLLELLNALLVGRHFEAWMMGRKRKRSADKPLAVDWIVGACLVMDKTLFHSTGGFDQSFFLFFEEMDLCKRLSDREQKVMFAPGCQIEHVGSVSGKRDYVLFTKRFYEGKIRFLAKHHCGIQRAVMLRLVWLQMWAQRVLWSIPWHGEPEKAAQKKRGFGLALEFLSSFRTTELHQIRE